MNYIVKPILFDYSTYKEIIEELIREYPFLSVNLMGRSALDRGIFSLGVGNEENSVIYCGGICGDESIASLVSLLFIERICQSIKKKESLCGVDIKRAFTQLGITVIPCLNPDGIELVNHGESSAKSLRHFVSSIGDISRWKANTMGVDLRYNFTVSKEGGSPSARGFGGNYSESEAEVKALTRLCRLRSFRQALTLHKGNRPILYQHDITAPHSQIMTKILSDSCNSVMKEDADGDMARGFGGWFSSRFHKPSFTLEIGQGDDIHELYKLYAGLEEALVLFALM